MRQVRIRENIDEMPELCNVEVALVVIGGKWKMLILKYLLDGTLRFGELRKMLPSVTPRMLSRQLKELETDGLVTRAVYAEVPPRTEYSVSELGESLRELVDKLDSWGAQYRDSARPAAVTGSAEI
ncbi:winged helix-turn-helix transcriptional regulator [Lentzea chajnantorensis]